MMEQLTIYPEQMLANLESLGGVVHSGEVLLALTRAGILREDAYRIVQRNAMATWTALGKPGRARVPRQSAGRPRGRRPHRAGASWMRRWGSTCTWRMWTTCSRACSRTASAASEAA